MQRGTTSTADARPNLADMMEGTRRQRQVERRFAHLAAGNWDEVLDASWYAPEYEQVLRNPVVRRQVEARWRLVDTSWELNISRRLVSVKHDIEAEQFFYPTRIGEWT